MQNLSNTNTDSVLNTVKKMLGIPIEYDAFDTDIIIHINSVLSILTQMGVLPTNDNKTVTEIFDGSTKWSEIIGDDNTINGIRTYVYLKVRLLFDPPTNSALLESFNRQINEFEYRLYTRKGGY